MIKKVVELSPHTIITKNQIMNLLFFKMRW